MTTSATAILAEWGRSTVAIFAERLAITDFMAVFQSTAWLQHQEAAIFFQNLESFWSNWEQLAQDFQFLPENLVENVQIVAQEAASTVAPAFSPLRNEAIRSPLVSPDVPIFSPFEPIAAENQLLSEVALPFSQVPDAILKTQNEILRGENFPFSQVPDVVAMTQNEILRGENLPFSQVPNAVAIAQNEALKKPNHFLSTSAMLSRDEDVAAKTTSDTTPKTAILSDLPIVAISNNEQKIATKNFQDFENNQFIHKINSPIVQKQPLPHSSDTTEQAATQPIIKTSNEWILPTDLAANHSRPIQEMQSLFHITDNSFEHSPKQEPIKTDWNEFALKMAEKSEKSDISIDLTPTKEQPLLAPFTTHFEKELEKNFEPQNIISQPTKSPLFSSTDFNKLITNFLPADQEQQPVKNNEIVDIWQKPLGNLGGFAAFANAAIDTPTSPILPLSMEENNTIINFHEPNKATITPLQSAISQQAPPPIAQETIPLATARSIENAENDDFYKKEDAILTTALQTDALLEALTYRIAQEYKRFYP
jgi:hypothetical protein